MTADTPDPELAKLMDGYVELTDRQRAVMDSIPGFDAQAQLERDVNRIREGYEAAGMHGVGITVSPPQRIDLSRVNDANPGWSDAALFGDQLPVGQPRFQATPSDAARAKARAKRKRKAKR